MFDAALTHPRSGPVIAVVAVHVLLGYALVTGTAHRILDAVIRPVQVALLEPPPPPKPPEPVALPPPPPLELPRPVFVPAPEIHIQRVTPDPPTVVQTTPVALPAPLAATTPPPAAPPVAKPQPRPTEQKPAPDLSRAAKIDVARCARPEYPAVARRAEATGTSRIRFQVDEAGNVVDAEVLKRSGHSRAHRELDQAAMQALGRCTFSPGLDKAGHPTGTYATVEYVWRLE